MFFNDIVRNGIKKDFEWLKVNIRLRVWYLVGIRVKFKWKVWF